MCLTLPGKAIILAFSTLKKKKNETGRQKQEIKSGSRKPNISEARGDECVMLQSPDCKEWRL